MLIVAGKDCRFATNWEELLIVAKEAGLPLELFGRQGYGRRIGWCTSAKQLTSAIAPDSFSSR